jgi:release factor glutamine methyltransferase
MTVAEVIHAAVERLEAEGIDIDDARLETEVLLASALGIDRSHLLANLRDGVPDDAGSRFEQMLARRLEHEPLAYIVGHREFYGIDIACGPGALIPRPETEMLVDLALQEVRASGSGVRIVDVGTGSGAIAVAIAVHAPEVRVVGIEASEEALAVARRNVERYRLGERVAVQAGDLLEGTGVFDVIVANLPYVSEADWQTLAPEIREREPRLALVAGASGTEVVERLLDQAPTHLAPGGMLAAEIGDTQGARVLTAAHRCFPEAECCVMKDLGGRDRVLVVRTGSGG